MPDRDISPIPDSPKPEGATHFRTEDDIELPSTPEHRPKGKAESDWSSSTSGSGNGNGLSKAIGIALVLGAVTLGSFFAFRGGSLEQKHENWRYVAAAADASSDSQQQLLYVDGNGVSQSIDSLGVSGDDADRSATRDIRSALRRGDLVTATAMLQAAQRMPSASQNPDVRPPVLTADSELANELKNGRKELYQIELFDCCHEDGDIVEVLVNSSHFATVPIMHEGTLLSIPLDRGNNSVTVRGVKDGGGGVTLSFRTSRGDYFARYMDVGEGHTMGVVVQ